MTKNTCTRITNCTALKYKRILWLVNPAYKYQKAYKTVKLLINIIYSSSTPTLLLYRRIYYDKASITGILRKKFSLIILFGL